jgi:hypothetical protein
VSAKKVKKEERADSDDDNKKTTDAKPKPKMAFPVHCCNATTFMFIYSICRKVHL